MKRRRNRDIQIFSLSAIDLFAAAMSAFALLTIVLIPDYQKTIKERTPERNFDDQLRAAEESKVETEQKKKALAEKVEAAKANLSDIESEAKKKLADLISAESVVTQKRAAAERVIEPPEPVEAKETGPTQAKAIVSFRFLGMKTSKNDIQLALDLNECMGGHETGYKDAVGRIIDSLQPNHRLSIVGFSQAGSGPNFRTWPASGGLQAMDASGRQSADRYAKDAVNSIGGSSAMLTAFDRMLAQPGEAIFLVSDGFPSPRFNNGLTPSQLADEITRRNAGRKEIHTVIIGSYFQFPDAVAFMQTLARKNRGQFMALASANRGACD